MTATEFCALRTGDKLKVGSAGFVVEIRGVRNSNPREYIVRAPRATRDTFVSEMHCESMTLLAKPSKDGTLTISFQDLFADKQSQVASCSPEQIELKRSLVLSPDDEFSK